MQNTLSPSDWKLRAHICLARAGYRCEDCGTPHGVLRIGKKSKSPYIVYLHAAHVNHDPEHSQAELRALCPSCHMKHDRRTERAHMATRKRGYQVISATRLVLEARGAGLHISQHGDRYSWQIGDLSGIAADVLDAIGSALHCLEGNAERVVGALGPLPHNKRLVLALLASGYREVEIARRVGETPRTVRYWLALGRMHLAQAMEGAR